MSPRYRLCFEICLGLTEKWDPCRDLRLGWWFWRGSEQPGGCEVLVEPLQDWLLLGSVRGACLGGTGGTGGMLKNVGLGVSGCCLVADDAQGKPSVPVTAGIPSCAPAGLPETPFPPHCISALGTEVQRGRPGKVCTALLCTHPGGPLGSGGYTFKPRCRRRACLSVASGRTF